MTFKNGDNFSGSALAGLYSSSGYGIVLCVLYVEQPPPRCETASGSGGSAVINFTLINVVATSSRLTATVARLSCPGGPVCGTVSLSKQ